MSKLGQRLRSPPLIVGKNGLKGDGSGQIDTGESTLSGAFVQRSIDSVGGLILEEFVPRLRERDEGFGIGLGMCVLGGRN